MPEKEPSLWGQSNEESQNNDQGREEIKQRIEFSFDPSIGSNYELEIFDASAENPRVRLEKTIPPSPDDVQAGTKEHLHLVLEAVLVTDEYPFDDPEPNALDDEKKTIWNVTSANFRMGDKSITEKDILRPGQVLQFGGAYKFEPHYDLDAEHVYFQKMDTIQDFINLLHEAGHAYDYAETPPSDLDRIHTDLLHFDFEEFEQKFPDQEVRIRAVKQHVKRERAAWAKALNIVKKSGLPVMKQMRTRAQKALRSYDSSLEESPNLDSSPESFATNEKRKAARRKPGK